jgi:2,3-dihydroxybenzoate---[aryl-carrier protein] ligase
MLDGCTPWPPEIAARYRERGYWRGENLSGMLREWAGRYGQATALVHGSRRISYAELDQRADRMAASLLRAGVGAGDRIVVQLPNVPEFVVLCFALFRIDAKPVFSLMAHRARELSHLVSLSGAASYVTAGSYAGAGFAELAAAVKAECPALRQVFVLDIGGQARADAGACPDYVKPLAEAGAAPEPPPSPAAPDVAFFLLSGGTTALPKLIPRTHDDYCYQTRAAAGLLGLSSADVYLAVLPAAFNFTLGCPGIVGTLRSGGTVVLAGDPDPEDCFATIARERVTFTSLVPALAQVWLDAAEDIRPQWPALRLIQIGGAPLPREVAERIAPVFGCSLQQVFGMAEGFLSFTRESDPAEAIVTTQGRPLSPGDELRIVDSDGTGLPPGSPGELLVRGPYTLRGYYRAPEHNATAFTADGFYRTGDIARLTAQGRLVIEGRLKDVIIRGGNKISAAEVEEHLLGHPAVERVAVAGIPDPYLGERICAFVRPAGEPPVLPALRQWLHDKGIAGYKLPDRLEIVSGLPLTGLGKVDKKLLVKEAAARAAGAAAMTADHSRKG